jgi:hypothetical protein
VTVKVGPEEFAHASTVTHAAPKAKCCLRRTADAYWRANGRFAYQPARKT